MPHFPSNELSPLIIIIIIIIIIIVIIIIIIINEVQRRPVC